MNKYDRIWKELATSARQVPVQKNETVPLGFATRVVTQAFQSHETDPLEIWVRCCWKTLIVACAIIAICAAIGFAAQSKDWADESLLFPPSFSLGKNL